MTRRALALLACWIAVGLPSVGRAQGGVDQVPGGIVVDFVDGTTKAQFDQWEQGWGIDLELASFVGEQSGITIASGVADPERVLALIRSRPEVEFAEPLALFSVPPLPGESSLESAPESFESQQGEYVPNDPYFPKQWNLKMVRMPAAWTLARGKGVVVAVIDTGVAYEDRAEFRQVPDLAGARFAKGYDFVNKDEHADDDHGHGTHVAGTIAQRTNNGTGVAGVAFEATIMPVKVLDHFGHGNSANIADAIRFAADRGAKVLNLSLGGGARSQVLENAIAYARKKGAVVVCAAGNTGQRRVEFPAAYPGAIAVSALGPDAKLAPYSSFGPEVDLSAPGGNKLLGDNGGILQNTIDPRDPSKSIYVAYQGTSMAAPHVSAVAALLFSSGARTPDEVEAALFAGAKKIQTGEKDERFGHGLLDARGSLEAVGSPAVTWGRLFWALSLLAVVLLTLRRRERPGYLNVLARPSFLLALLSCTVGFFFLRWLFSGGGAAGTLVDAALIPIPDWQKYLFGRGQLANPLVYSALLPILGSFLTARLEGARPWIGGLAIGFSGFLAYAAFSGAPALAWLPFSFLAFPWLLGNALVCLVLARAMLRRTS